MNDNPTLFPIEPKASARSFQVRNLRLVSEVVCEAPTEYMHKPEDVISYLGVAFDDHPGREQCWAVLLNSRNRIIGRHLISVGSDRQTILRAVEVFRCAILGGASAVVLAHNHPSGDPAPSSADVQATRQVRAASEILDIRLQDHIIIGEAQYDPQGLGYYSFRNAGMI